MIDYTFSLQPSLHSSTMSAIIFSLAKYLHTTIVMRQGLNSECYARKFLQRSWCEPCIQHPLLHLLIQARIPIQLSSIQFSFACLDFPSKSNPHAIKYKILIWKMNGTGCPSPKSCLTVEDTNESFTLSYILLFLKGCFKFCVIFL